MQGKQIYEVCPIHPKEFLQVVCTECEINSIACPLCIDLSHKNHVMISLKKFIASELPKLYAKKPDHKILTKGINELASQYQSLFEKMRKLVGQELNDLEKLYQGEIEALHQENNLVCGIGEKLYTVKNVSLLKTKIKNGEQIPDSKTFTSKISQLGKKMQFLVGEVTEDICEIIRGLTNFWDASKELLLNSKREFKVYYLDIVQFHFSSDLKHRALSIQINTWKGRKMVNDLYDNSYHIGVVEPPLNPFKNEIQFRIEKSQNRCVWIGICDLKKIIDRRFSNCYKRGEGGYWIWQAGYKGGAQYFSNLLSESQNLPWNFDVGQVVKVRLVYDQQNRFVQFQKNGQKIYRGKLDKANIYCACVAMGAENESVVILED